MSLQRDGEGFASEYMVFRSHVRPGRKTPIWTIKSKRSGNLLGYVKWYGAWRQYCFFPAQLTVFNKACLADINDFIEQLMTARATQQVAAR